MSYYCEMCGRELDVKTLRRAVVEGTPLILCPNCYSKLSKRTSVREQPLKQSVKVGVTTRTQTKRTGTPLEQLEIVEDYAVRVRSAREALGWTQEVLAQKVGESVLTIKRIESGRLKPSVDLARKLERVLGIKLLEPVMREDMYISVGSEKADHLTIGDVINIESKMRK